MAGIARSRDKISDFVRRMKFFGFMHPGRVHQMTGIMVETTNSKEEPKNKPTRDHHYQPFSFDDYA